MDQVSNDWWPKFSDSEYRRRFESLRAAMDESNLDALAIYGAAMFFGTDPGAPNLAYLSAYAPGLQGYVVFPRQGDPMMAIYVASHLANARRLSVLADVRAGTDLPGLVRDRLDELGLTKGGSGSSETFHGRRQRSHTNITKRSRPIFPTRHSSRSPSGTRNFAWPRATRKSNSCRLGPRSAIELSTRFAEWLRPALPTSHFTMKLCASSMPKAAESPLVTSARPRCAIQA